MVVARLVGLALLLWGITSEVRPGLSGPRLAVGVLAACLVPAWITWTAEPGAGRRGAVAFVGLSAAGGALAVFAPLALAAAGTGALGAAVTFELPGALAISASAPVAALVTALAAGHSSSVALSALAASLAGTVIGVGRRQGVERTRQAIRVTVERERAELAQARAGVLAERNRLARDLHDVLAHTLGGLVVQLEALDARLDRPGGGGVDVRTDLRRTRALAVEGLDEARRAVRALRDDEVPIDEELERLCAHHGAVLSIVGVRRVLSPEMSLALQRVAQESLTNAAKHAPGAAVEVVLDYRASGVVLTVANGRPASAPGPLAASGGGYGLEGMAERVHLVGGTLTAEPAAEGWRVECQVPG